MQASGSSPFQDQRLSRVVEYVPQYDEVVKPQIVDQAANLRPINVVGSPVQVKDDAVSLSDDEPATLMAIGC